ncbi:uncharacterized protein LOC125193593 [Salvia hispanica]|uniref:uncharacterized protein LOC125193593 n=1 Tax=Salvia hispanica TaxID=49212 RepID=UPI00200961C4|nr:uncharacterized protein LOC125193593 [Salvia hispanica]
MTSPSRIMRKSIFTFLQNFHHLSTAPALLLLPFAASTLLSPPLVASSRLFPLLHGRLHSLFLAAGIPPQSELFAILNLKLAQTILSFSFSLPFSLSFLLLAKAAVVKLLHHHNKPHSFLSLISTFNRLVSTQICNSLLILATNATCFCLLAAAFNLSDAFSLSSPRFRLLLSATGAICYSIALANAYIVSGLALIIAAAEDSGAGAGGFSSILEACVAIRGRTSAALSLAVPMNMALAAVEALFQYRVLSREIKVTPAMVAEAALVAYLYAVVLIIDTIVGYVFLKSCREEQRDFCPHRIEFIKQGKAMESAV